MIKSASHSKLVDFEKCKFLAWLKHDQRIPEPERPLPPGKTEHANDRGTRVHNAAELYVRGDGPLVPEMKTYAAEFERLAEMYEAGMVSLEGEWGMDVDWNPCDWKKAWLRLKLDALVFLSPQEAVAIDYKTGKKFGNEIKHGEQVLIYQLCTFLRYPELETVHTELWYLDADDMTQRTLTRQQGLRFRKNFHDRFTKMTTCMEFPPNPSIHTCKWCQYGPWNGGQCKVGVR